MGVHDGVAARVGGRADRAWRGVAAAALLAGSLAVSAGPAAAGGGWTAAVPARVFAPYVDVSLTESEKLLADGSKAGLDVATLAFVVSAVNAKREAVCAPAWGGIGPIERDRLANGTTIQSLVRATRKAGDNVIVSFGGANPTELALACPTTAKLQAAYQAVVDRYQATSIDLDVEGDVAADRASITRRDKALVALRAANPGLHVSYTLEATTGGLDPDAARLLADAKAHGLEPDVVNIMAMDYGVAQTAAQMLADAKRGATGAETTIRSLGLTSAVGITPMIGVNDSPHETFTLADAKGLLAFARANAWVGRLAMWSLGRDNGGCAGAATARPTCSGLSQASYAFSAVFHQFGGAAARGR